MDAPDRKPWDRRPDESAKAYKAFCIYLEMGPKARSIDAAGCEYQGHQKGIKRASGFIRRWASQFDWPKRAAAWDAHQLAEHRARWKDELDRVRGTFVDGAPDAARAVLRMVRSQLEPQAAPEEGDRPQRLDRTALQAAIAVLKFAGLVEAHKVEHTGDVGHNVTHDPRPALRELTSRPDLQDALLRIAEAAAELDE